MSYALGGLMIAGAAIAATGAIYSTVAQGEAARQQAEFNEDMAEFNALQAKENASAALERANLEARVRDAETDAEIANARRRNAMVMAENRAQEGMLGFDGTGTSLLLAVENAENSEAEAREIQRVGRYEADMMRYEGQLAAWNGNMDAEKYQMEASNYRSQGKSIAANTVVGSIFGGISGALSGASAGASAYGGMQKLTASGASPSYGVTAKGPSGTGVNAFRDFYSVDKTGKDFI